MSVSAFRPGATGTGAIVAALCLAAGAAVGAAQAEPDLAGCRRSFDENFSGRLSTWSPARPSGRWKTNYAFGRQGDWTSRNFPATGEKQLYVDAGLGVNPFKVSGGLLTIHAAPTPQALKPRLWNYAYVSGVLTTEKSFSMTYGYVEARMELPMGKGTWPAFWLIPTDLSWPPEIDVMEAVGKPEVRQTIHTRDAAGKPADWGMTVPLRGGGMHRFGALWTPRSVTFFVDGRKTGETATPPDMHKPMYLVLNLGIGGTWPGDPDPAIFRGANLRVDYVRAWRCPVAGGTVR